MQPVPINDAEGIIEAFWDPVLSELTEYVFEPGDSTAAEVTQDWWCVALSWQKAKPGESIFTMRREMNVSLEGYDALRIRCAVPSSAKLILKAVIDGCEQIVVDGVTGENKKWEYTGAVSGKQLERLTISYEAISDAAGGGTIQWIALVNRQVERIRNSRHSPYTPDWPKFLEPADHPATASPALGLLFDEKDLIRIRRNIAHPSFRPLMDSLRQKAHSHLNAQPEQFVMESSATINRHHRVHDIARGDSDPANIAITCGFVGLVDENVELRRMSARAMLAMAHAEYWDECFQEHFPGSSFDHRSFTASDYAYACAIGLDWAGDLLTEAGRRIIIEAVSKKGLSLINKDFVQYEYIFDCNQAATFSQGRIAGLLAMRSLWPKAEPWIDIAERDLIESLDRVFNLTEDHGSLEGPSYAGATLLRALRALAMLSRYRNKSLKQMTPESMSKCSDYYFMFLSTVGSPGSFIPYGDGHDLFKLDMVSLMSIAVDSDPRWENLRSAMISRQTPLGVGVNANVPGLLTLILTDPPTSEGFVDVPVFSLLGSTGMLESCRPTSAGPVRLQLIGSAEGAGHVHQDKGSFILEAFGDTLAIDRGMVNYGHPLSRTLMLVQMHNVLTPTPADDRYPEQELIAEHCALPTGKGDRCSLDAEIDTTAIWIDQPFKKCRRRIHSPDPTLFFIEDVVEFAEPRGVVFHLHTNWPITREKGSFLISGQRSRLLVTPIWNPAEAAFCENLFDRDNRPVNHLTITSGPGRSYSLVTVLQVLESDSEKGWNIEADGEDTGTIVATRAGKRHVFSPNARHN